MANQWGNQTAADENLWDDLLPLCDTMRDFESAIGETPDRFMSSRNHADAPDTPWESGESWTCADMQAYLTTIMENKLAHMESLRHIQEHKEGVLKYVDQ